MSADIELRQGEIMGPLDGGAVLFDLDGTLVDTADDLAASMNHALTGFGLAPTSPDEVRHLVGHGARRMLMRGFELANGEVADEATLDAALARFLDYYQAHIADHSRPFPGAVEMIEALRAEGACMAVCTNKREAMARLLLETLGLDGLFGAIVGGDTASAAKPDPAPIHLCLETLGVGRGVFIGDSDTDIKAAAAAGLPCLVASFGYGPVTLAGKAHSTFGAYDDAAPTVRHLLS